MARSKQHIADLRRINTRYLQELRKSGETMTTEKARHDYGANYSPEDIDAVLFERIDREAARKQLRLERQHALAHCKLCGVEKTALNTGKQGNSWRATCKACTAQKRRQERQTRKELETVPF